MVFPATPLGLTVELLINSVWTAITSLIYGRDDLTVTRGGTDEVPKANPSRCKATANNRNGNLSPRNPTGTYYGQIGRNTRMRVRKDPHPLGYLLTTNAVGTSGATTPDSANLSITGDIDIRVDIRPRQWGRLAILAHKYNSTGNQRSWTFFLNANNTISLRWSPDGTFASSIRKDSTVAITPPASGRLAVRVTLDVDNGAAGNDVKFWTSDSVTGTWTQLGATVTTAGTTSIFDSTAVLGLAAGEGAGLIGRLYAAQIYQGIAGTLRADVNLDDEDAGATSFADGTSNTWTLLADTSIVDPSIRFNGEISEWPQKWDTSGKDIYVPIEASGILRRLSQGDSPLKSTLYRGYTSATFTPKAYWPGEDGTGATQIASGIGGPAMSIRVVGTPATSEFTGFKCSAPLLPITGTEWKGAVPAYTSTGNVQVWWIMQVPASGGSAVAGQGISSVYTTGTAVRWDVVYEGAGGDLRVKALDAAGTTILDSGAVNFNIDGQLLRVSLDLKQNGANIDWSLSVLQVGQSFGTVTSGTLNTNTVGRCLRVVMNPGGDIGDLVVGHISVHDSIRSIFDLFQELNAYIGETAGRRIKRLCTEESVAFRAVGDLDATAAMGAQLPAELVTLLQDAADADGGILYEPRDLFGLAYRVREDLYNQPALLTLDYAAKHLSGIVPTDDDQQTRNDITVTRPEGSSFRAVQETGVLSVLAPPSGVGRYDESVTRNLQADSQVGDAAGWLLHLGTVDEARYPELGLDLARSVFVNNSALALAAEDLDIGDRLIVDNPPAWLPPDDITQLAQGFTETCNAFTHLLNVNCSPESPWGQAGVYDATTSRYSSDGSTLGATLTTTATSVSVVTPSGRLWSHADGDFDIRIGGEVMRVTAVTGASSPQTFTVTRSINGVVKAHNTTGVPVALDHPVVYVR